MYYFSHRLTTSPTYYYMSHYHNKVPGQTITRHRAHFRFCFCRRTWQRNFSQSPRHAPYISTTQHFEFSLFDSDSFPPIIHHSEQRRFGLDGFDCNYESGTTAVNIEAGIKYWKREGLCYE